MENTLVKYIRNSRGDRLIGALLATPAGIGWSAVHPRDTFDKTLALRIAAGRIQSGTTASMPRHVAREYPDFYDRATRYFRWPS